MGYRLYVFSWLILVVAGCGGGGPTPESGTPPATGATGPSSAHDGRTARPEVGKDEFVRRAEGVCRRYDTRKLGVIRALRVFSAKPFLSFGQLRRMSVVMHRGVVTLERQLVELQQLARPASTRHSISAWLATWQDQVRLLDEFAGALGRFEADRSKALAAQVKKATAEQARGAHALSIHACSLTGDKNAAEPTEDEDDSPAQPVALKNRLTVSAGTT